MKLYDFKSVFKKEEKIIVYWSNWIIEVQKWSIKRFDIKGELIESLTRE